MAASILTALLCATTAVECLKLPHLPLKFGGNGQIPFVPDHDLFDPAAGASKDAAKNVVTWDKHSLFVHGERILFYSGEFHPFRLPVTSLWEDVFQKIRAIGYNGVSFYIDWALLEGKQGEFKAEGIFDLQPLFDAATKTGIYLLARPGPYINAEVSGGGFPGWLQRLDGNLRSSDKSYLKATETYVAEISAIIEKAQITNGGPVIMLQPENEYGGGDKEYFAYVRDQFINNSITVPLINNDVGPYGQQTPGGIDGVDIYGHDGYPLGFDCSNPTRWPEGAGIDAMRDWHIRHLDQSPDTPYSVIEFQGGSYDPWGGPGFDKCNTLIDHEFERVFYKELASFGITIQNIYMIYGGTNWGNLGHPGGYSSYDYAAMIRENRAVDREKYSEAKLLAYFLQASPAYLTATPGNETKGEFTTKALTVTPLLDSKSDTGFFVVRQSDYASRETIDYKIKLPVSGGGRLTIPQLGGALSLHGRDSKIFVTNYDIGGIKILYSTAEIMTWQKYSSKTVLILYAGAGETSEVAIQHDKTGLSEEEDELHVLEGDGIMTEAKPGARVINFDTSSQRRIVRLGSLIIYILDRNSAYKYWALPLAGSSDVLVKAGYLMRSVSQEAGTLRLVGDFNETTSIEIIGAPDFYNVQLNGKPIVMAQDHATGIYSDTLVFAKPQLDLPDFASAKWYGIDTMPELKSWYSDDEWTVANKTECNNPHKDRANTPMVLFASDYGYHYGSIIYRGHYKSNGKEGSLKLLTTGGTGFGMSCWLDGVFLGSEVGSSELYKSGTKNNTFVIPSALSTKGKHSVITVLIDAMGLNEELFRDLMKEPRGILDYDLAGHDKEDVTWKLTGNIGGEDYIDKVRGPANEGALFAERQGYHQPYPPVDSQGWTAVRGGPLTGITDPGVAFYTTSFDLDMPKGYDIPLSFAFNNGTVGGGGDAAYRAQLWVNGYQFGEYVHNLGPQHTYPVPEGILDYHGTNWVAVSLWALEEGGAKIEALTLQVDAVVLTGMKEVVNSPMPHFKPRQGAY